MIAEMDIDNYVDTPTKTGCDRYVDDVLSGKIVTCLYVKKAVERFVADKQRDDLDYIPEKAERVVEFVSHLKHSVGKFENRPFILSDWQIFIVHNLYGFYWKDGHRRITSTYIECSRKQGKSAFLAALGLYAMVADGEGGAEVLVVANSKEQAKILFNIASNFVKKADPRNKLFNPYRYDIRFARTNSVMKVLSADSSKLDGYNASWGVVDEYHSAPDSSVRDVIKSSMGMRENPMLCTITTAGFNKTLPCYALRQSAIDVIMGLKTDDSLFAIIYTLDEGDDWTDENVWIKASPNLGVTVTKKYLTEQVQQAKNNPSEEVAVLTKNFNIWCDAASIWIPSQYITMASKTVDINKYAGCEAYLGVDLASVQDMTALCASIKKDNEIFSIFRYYVPEESLATRPDKELYKNWAKEGYLTITPGNVTDYEYITKDILDLSKVLRVKKIAYDEWNSTQWATNATKLKLPLEPYSQTVGNFNGPTRELERRILTGKIVIDNNPIIRWNFDNVVIRMDANGNIKPDKAKSASKIDGIIALIQSLAMLIESDIKPKSRITL